MRNSRRLTVLLLCLALASPALAIEKEEQAPWSVVVDWVKGWIEGVVGQEGPEPPGEPAGPEPSEGEKGPQLEPNG